MQTNYLTHYICISILVFFNALSYSQSIDKKKINREDGFISSNLPMVFINTRGQEIPDYNRITAEMGIIFNGEGKRNSINNEFNNYSGKVNIEIRGSSSLRFEKKGYGFETQDDTDNKLNISLLGLPEENDWILQGENSDKTFIRNALTYQLSREMGWYSPRTRFCELWLDDDYQGIYLLTEKIKRDKNRVDIAKLNSGDIQGDQLTGGYIIKIDRFNDMANDGWVSPYNPIENDDNHIVYFMFHDPKPNELNQVQKDYIQQYVTDFEDVLSGSNFADPNKGYSKYINVNSFVDYLIINELCRNVDAYRVSAFFHKDRTDKGGKLNAGPLWDCNLAWGNCEYCEGALTTGWSYEFNSICNTHMKMVPFWWKRLMEDNEFNNKIRNRWDSLRQGVLDLNHIFHLIDSMAIVLNEAQERNFKRWPILGQYVWPNPDPGCCHSYQEEVNTLKTWIKERIYWLDDNLPYITKKEAIDNSPHFVFNASVYPNPLNENSIINLTVDRSRQLSIELYTILGNTVNQNISGNFSKGAYQLKLNTESLQSGLYILLIKDNSKTEFKFKLFKK